MIIWQFIKDSGKTRPMFINFIPLIYFLVGAMVDNSFMYPQFYIIVAMALYDTNNKADKENQQVQSNVGSANSIEIQNEKKGS